MRINISHSLGKIIRTSGILLGIFLIISMSFDILGIRPYSDEMPSLVSRISVSILPLLFGLILLVPFKYVKNTTIKYIVGIFLLLGCLRTLWFLLYGTYAYVIGEKHIAVIPVSAILFLIVIMNSWLFVLATRKKSIDK